jgi:hypothetical protein
MRKKMSKTIYILFFLAMIHSEGCKKTIHITNQDNVKSGYDFIKEAEKLYVTAACGEIKGIHDASNARKKHCEEVKKYEDKFNAEFTTPAEGFFSKKIPQGISKKVMYPFGGCDLISAMVTFPDAEEITTISLEGAGDPEGLNNVSDEVKTKGLEYFRPIIKAHLITKNTSNASAVASETGVVPGQLGFSLAAAKMKGYRPVSLRYFQVEPDGSLHYYSKEEIETQKDQKAKKLKWSWVDAGFSEAYRNMEIVFENDTGKKMVHRHVAWNLDNKHFENSGLHKFLQKQGKISTMTKAASYLMWFDSFSVIRNYLLENSDFMISDATGILPRHANKAGYRLETWGRFTKAFLDNGGGRDTEEFINEFARQPSRKPGFFYGHADANANPHLILYYKNQDNNRGR